MADNWDDDDWSTPVLPVIRSAPNAAWDEEDKEEPEPVAAPVAKPKPKPKPVEAEVVKDEFADMDDESARRLRQMRIEEADLDNTKDLFGLNIRHDATDDGKPRFDGQELPEFSARIAAYFKKHQASAHYGTLLGMFFSEAADSLAAEQIQELAAQLAAVAAAKKERAAKAAAAKAAKAAADAEAEAKKAKRKIPVKKVPVKAVAKKVWRDDDDDFVEDDADFVQERMLRNEGKLAKR